MHRRQKRRLLSQQKAKPFCVPAVRTATASRSTSAAKAAAPNSWQQILNSWRSAGVAASLIGGSLGLSPAVLAAADRRLSFSAMTFPHQLMRIILLEQIYRAFKINHHETYHK